MDPEVTVALVALVISLVALLATAMQVLQQYLASAAGYSQCSTKVMGDWALTKSRKFSWEELRFEVEFDAPVILVSPPTNTKGPVKGQPLCFLDGTDDSLKDTCTTKDEQIHTADNELASWCTLLAAVQRMEADSCEWQREQYGLQDTSEQEQHELQIQYGWSHEAKQEQIRRRKFELQQHGLAPSPPSLRDAHTLTVALQRKRKSWDTMPSSVARPYATTTMCHLVEMMAALGVYWKEFDRKYDRYRAEGNGFMALGERVTDLGLMFVFNVYGKSRFERNRVIPVDEIKELCFGCVPTIYRETYDQRRLEFPTDAYRNLGTIQMASRTDIAETLVLIGCNINTVQYFRDPSKWTSHLFPISFEVLGMLSRTFHINHTAFTYIPNPTPDRWDKMSLSMEKMVEAYEEQIELAPSIPGVDRNNHVSKLIRNHTRTIIRNCHGTDGIARLKLLKALHEALDDCDEILTARSRSFVPTAVTDPNIPRPDPPNPETERQKLRRETVQDVLRSHIQEVLRLLNEREERIDTQSLYVPPGPPSPGATRERPQPPTPRFEDMHAASPDDRQHKFMEVYFHVIRQRVVPRATDSTDRRRSSIVAPPGYGFSRAGTGRSLRNHDRPPDSGSTPHLPPLPLPATGLNQTGARPSTAPSRQQPPAVSMPLREYDSSLGGSDSEDLEEQEEGERLQPLPQDELEPLFKQKMSHDDIWCTLVFRMICWLMLHDFNKLDVQTSKSELLGSRMPVYIG